MRLSYNWLSDFVDLSGLSPEEVADQLTMGAFEVEEIKRIGADIQGQVVVGQIVEILPHPDPSVTKMRVTRTRIKPDSEPEIIVCGAWNIEPGQHVPVALPGAKVLDRKTGGVLPIERTEKRGVTSNGMLCSPPELGITGSGEGILILDPSTTVGADAKELLGIKKEAVLIVEPRSNRGDALSVLGLAREVAALLHRPLTKPIWQLPEAQPSDRIEVAAEDEDDCPFFTIRTLSGIKVGSSPAWMINRLEAVGMRSVNNVVDITNYVMLELGQPLHGYDISRLHGNFIEVRRARTGESLTTLDERQRQLSDQSLVIADKQGVIGIAGVMGGKSSEISPSTTAVALEAAAFNARRVRRSSRQLGLSSDSSLRFERGVDVAGVQYASDRAAHLLIEHCGARLGALSTTGSDKCRPLTVTLRLSELARLTELELSLAETESLLTPLGFKVQAESGDTAKVSVPTFRLKDVTREVDLIEEITRLYGYDKVPVSMPKTTVAPPLPASEIDTIKSALCAAGLNETWMSSLVSISDLSGRGSFEADIAKAIQVLNPLSDEHQVLRLSLLPGLLKAVAYNQDRGRADVWLFETGLIYERQPPVKSNRSDTGTVEQLTVSGVISGIRQLGTWNTTTGADSSAATKDDQASDFYVLKGVLENLFARLYIAPNKVTFANEADKAPSWLHPLRSARILHKHSSRHAETSTLGFLGQVHPVVAAAYGLKRSACLFELSLDTLKAAATKPVFAEFFSTPSMVRDLTADVPKITEQGAVKQLIAQVAGKFLRNVELVSTFDLSAENKSLSYRLNFQHPEQTLTGEEIDKVVGRVKEQLARQLSAAFRA